MNGRFTSSSKLISASEKKPGHSLQQFSTHDHFDNLIYFSGKSHILENTEYFAPGQIGSPSDKKTSLYPEKIFSAFNCFSDFLYNEYAQIYIYHSRRLRQ